MFSNGQEAALACAVEQCQLALSPGEVPIPIELLTVVSAVVQARRQSDWPRQLARLLGGIHFGIAGQLRREVAWVLGRLGYGDDVIAHALGVGRLAIASGRRVFEARLAADVKLRAWFEGLLSPSDGASATEAA
jgi:hypothetical protein